MQSIVCSEFAPIENLELKEVTPPELHRGQVRLDVYACGVNFPDILMVQGKYQVRPELPFAPGGEVAGVVVEVADDVNGVNLGQKVMATIFWGGMAEQAVTSQDVIVPIPEGMDYLTASVVQYCSGIYSHVRRANNRDRRCRTNHRRPASSLYERPHSLRTTSGRKTVARTGCADRNSRRRSGTN